MRVRGVLFVAQGQGRARAGERQVRLAGGEMRVCQAHFSDFHVHPGADALPVPARGRRRGLHQSRAGGIAIRGLLQLDGQVVAGHREGARGGVGRRWIVGRERQGLLEQGHGLGRAAPAGEGRGCRRQHAHAGRGGMVLWRGDGGQFPLSGVAVAGSQVQRCLRQVELSAAGLVGPVARMAAEGVEECGPLVPAAEVLAADVRRQDTEGRQLPRLLDQVGGVLTAGEDRCRLRRVVAPALVQEGVEVRHRALIASARASARRRSARSSRARDGRGGSSR